ncbi:hypothetical protein [Paracoccus sp. (in: a-proteobacteria)]
MPWIAAACLALLSAFMMASAIVVLGAFLVVLPAACTIADRFNA